MSPAGTPDYPTPLEGGTILAPFLNPNTSFLSQYSFIMLTAGPTGFLGGHAAVSFRRRFLFQRKGLNPHLEVSPRRTKRRSRNVGSESEASSAIQITTRALSELVPLVLFIPAFISSTPLPRPFQ